MTNDKFFVITRLHRDDMKQEFPELAAHIDALEDWEMQEIASKMANAYLDEVTGCYLQRAARKVGSDRIAQCVLESRTVRVSERHYWAYGIPSQQKKIVPFLAGWC